MIERTDARREALLANLTPPQREAVTHGEGPLLILAGPGSGKTRVVTRRAAHLALTAARPHQILAITFTNKAAREMRERIDALAVGGGMTVCTFHALGARLLRQFHDRARVSPSYTIFDREDRRKLIKQAVQRCDLSDANWTPARVEASISRAKNAMQTAEAFAALASDWAQRTVARIYDAYERILAEQNGLDFDDLLMHTAFLLERDEELRSELQDRFRYVLVDEYQDTNVAQYRIALLLTQQRRNLCVTGDPDQSIYGWRGADIGNILSFERDFPDARVVRLEQNYRSTKRILTLADALISGNTRRKAKRLWTENEPGPPVVCYEAESSEDEAQFVVDEIRAQLAQGVAPGEIAVFYRVNSLSRSVEEALIRGGIRYQVARGVEFYNRREIKDVLAYLRAVINPADDVSLLRIINMPPRGIGAGTIDKLRTEANRLGVRLHDMLDPARDLSFLGRSLERVREFAQLLDGLKCVGSLAAPAALEQVLALSGLRVHYRALSETDDQPLANLDELVSAAAQFQRDHPEGTILDWLEHTALLGDVDSIEESREKVTLMTLHAAKGLEFTHVFMIGLEDGLLPMRRYDDDGGDEEEERRLCFVGMTRAKRRLTLTHARYRMIRGVTTRTVRSPFLDELPKDQLEWRGSGRKSGRRKRAPNGKLPDDLAQWTVGTLVRHPDLGLGQVMSLRRGSRRTHVDVLFRDGSRQQWVLEFANLERVDFDDVG